jgi:hypothetical protein
MPTAAIMARAINPAMRLYSMAVAALSSRRNFPNIHSLSNFDENGLARPSCRRYNQKRKIATFWAPRADVRFYRVRKRPRFKAALFSKPISFDARERRVTGVIPHTYAIGPSVYCDGTEGSTMYLIYGLLILAMIFFFVLPITDARTARMKVSVVGSLGVLLAVCAVVPRLIH